MKIENSWAGNFEGAIRGMRNPKNSWDASDSYTDENGKFIIGEKDLILARKLIRAGSEHRKFMRQIFVSADITAPLYWWKEAQTYKVATVTNSTSTMHKLAETPITLDCFETGDMSKDLIYMEAMSLDEEGKSTIAANSIEMFADLLIEQLEFLRLRYNETKDIRYWKELIRWLPEGWLQKRTWTANYEVLHAIVLPTQRGNHKLKNEWCEGFIHWVTTLPYAKELIFYGDGREKIYDLYK